MTKEEIFSFFHDLAIVPVVAIEDADKAVPLAKAMIDGGIPCAEVTFRTAAAEQAIKNMVAAFPEMVVGAGTVINPELAEKAVNAGAKFIVSAGLNPDTVKWCNDHNVPVTPGVCTPSEIEQGLSMGLNVLKFFPAEASGGVNMLKNFGGPFKQVKFMTTGGISPANLADYAKASNVLAIGTLSTNASGIRSPDSVQRQSRRSRASRSLTLASTQTATTRTTGPQPSSQSSV